ncbi:hypothetical protein B0T11DRAFT_282877, partial [Plectosphaerella cucumerina]
KSLNDSTLSVITGPHVRNCLIAGIVSIAFAFLSFISLLHGWGARLVSFLPSVKLLRAVLYLLFGLGCCVPFMVAVGYQVTMLSVLPSWVDVQQGRVFGLSVGCLCCGCGLALLGGMIPFVV